MGAITSDVGGFLRKSSLETRGLLIFLNEPTTQLLFTVPEQHKAAKRTHTLRAYPKDTPSHSVRWTRGRRWLHHEASRFRHKRAMDIMYSDESFQGGRCNGFFYRGYTLQKHIFTSQHAGDMIVRFGLDGLWRHDMRTVFVEA